MGRIILDFGHPNGGLFAQMSKFNFSSDFGI